MRDKEKCCVVFTLFEITGNILFMIPQQKRLHLADTMMHNIIKLRITFFVDIMSFKSTIDTKLREFQYKYIIRIIPQAYLFLNVIQFNRISNFYNSYIETVNHFFWECHYTQKFWSELKTFLATININIEFNIFTVTFGIIGKGQKNQLLNFIIISSKYFIFKS